jgi:hypothetical protein
VDPASLRPTAVDEFDGDASMARERRSQEAYVRFTKVGGSRSETTSERRSTRDGSLTGQG